MSREWCSAFERQQCQMTEKDRLIVIGHIVENFRLRRCRIPNTKIAGLSQLTNLLEQILFQAVRKAVHQRNLFGDKCFAPLCQVCGSIGTFISPNMLAQNNRSWKPKEEKERGEPIRYLQFAHSIRPRHLLLPLLFRNRNAQCQYFSMFGLNQRSARVPVSTALCRWRGMV